MTNLNKIEGIKPQQLKCNIFSVYDYEELTMQELLCKFFTKLNEVIGSTNEIINITEYLLNQGLEKEVVKKLTLWLNDGTLENLINENIFNELKKKIDTVEQIITDISKIEVFEDINGTNYKKGSKVDINYLRNIQSQNFNAVMYALRNKTKKITFCHIGDSLTYGYDIESMDKRENSSIFADGSTETTTIASKTYPEAFNEFMINVYGSQNIGKSINRGRSGDFALSSLKRHNKKHEGDISLLMLGTNDARATSCPYVGDVKEYLKYMEQIIIRELLWDKCVVILNSPIVKLQFDYRVDMFSNSLKQLAEKYGIPCIDTQNIINGYSYDIWSDATHFNGKGYTIMGYRIASAFIGEGLNKINKVQSGSIIPINDMQSSSVKINDVSYLNAPINITDTCNEHTETNGYYLLFGENGKAIFSFYTEHENLFIIPSLYLASNTNLKLSLDGGYSSCNLLSSSIYENNDKNNGNQSIHNIKSKDSSIRYNKKYCVENGIKPFRIANKGWHTITFEVENFSSVNPVSLFGIEFLHYDVYMNRLKNENLLLYKSPSEGGYPGVGEKINLIEDITKYCELTITTGGISDGSFTTSIIKSFANLPFRVDLDRLVFKTFNGYNDLSITGAKELKINSISDSIRYIYGKLK